MKFTGEEIKSLRQRLGWSSADLSRRLGCTGERVRAVEAGTATLQSAELEQLTILRMHLTSYTQQLESCPLAEEALRTNGFNQIHIKDLKN